MKNIEDIPYIYRESAISYSQSRKHSFFESIMNVVVGFGVALTSQIIIFPYYDIHIPIQSNLAIGGWMTIISIIRSYVLRRCFNKITINKNYE